MVRDRIRDEVELQLAEIRLNTFSVKRPFAGKCPRSSIFILLS